MNDDDELCLCFHVTRRKVRQFIRVEKPRRASELSQCYGAGTGCGWCRPFLKRMLDAQATEGTEVAGATANGDPADCEELSPEQYAERRRLWRNPDHLSSKSPGG